MDIIYFYIIIRYLIAIGLIVTSIVFFIKTILQRKFIFFVGFITPIIIIGWMFFYGAIRKPTLDIEDLCINFDMIYDDVNNCDVDNENVKMFFIPLNPDDSFEAIQSMKNEKHDKLLYGNYGNVQYVATYMYSDMLNNDNFFTYCGSYTGQIFLTKGNKTVEIYYIINTSQKDPKAIFYSFKPSDIKVSNYLEPIRNQQEKKTGDGSVINS